MNCIRLYSFVFLRLSYEFGAEEYLKNNFKTEN